MLSALLLVAAQPPVSADQLAKIKAATVYVGVQTPGRTSSGSGFLVRVEKDTGYVVTNAHVIDPNYEAREAGMTIPKSAPPTIVVSFDRGTPTERTVPATVVARGTEPDLAVLKLTGVPKLPAPLDVSAPPKVMELLPVLVCGFPFGQRNIDIGQASVSSLRTDAAGQLAYIQLTGSLNPGNSGGPVLTTDGKLVGVAVMTIRNAGKGLAVPAEQVAMLLRGRLGTVRLSPKIVGSGDLPATLSVEILDPFGKIKSVTAHYSATVEPPRTMSVPPTLVPKLTKLPMTLADGEATGELTVPAGRRGLTVQLEIDHADGKAFTPAYGVPLSVAPDLGTAGGVQLRLPGGQLLPFPRFRSPTDGTEDDDDNTLSTVNRAPDKFAGKPTTFDCLTRCEVRERDGKYDLTVTTAAGNEPSNLVVRVPKDLALQLAELGLGGRPDTFAFAVRLTGTVQKPGRDGRHPVEVAEVGFLDGGKVGVTLKEEKAAPAGKPTLSAVNRFPGDYVGQTVTVVGEVGDVKAAGRGYGLEVRNENGAEPLNLEFFTSKELFTAVSDDLPRGRHPARLTLAVERVDARTGHGLVGVSKVELIGADGGKGKTVASDGKIAYPPAPPAAKPVEKPAAKDEKAAAPPAEVPPPKTNWGLVAGVAVGGVVLVVGAAAVAFALLRRVATPPAKPTYTRKPAEDPPADGGDDFNFGGR